MADGVAANPTSPFLILALPRSRTFWLSRFLSYGAWSCGHEESIRMRSIDDVKSWLSLDCNGSAETTAAPYWRMLKHLRPDLKIVVVRRPVDEVVDSMMRTGVVADRASLEREIRAHDRKLDQIERRVPGVMSVRFKDLVREKTCKEIFEFCLSQKHDNAWWWKLSNLNMQANLPAMRRYIIAHLAQLRLLTSQCGQFSRSLLWSTGSRPDKDGFSFQEETFADLMRDGERIIAEHTVSVGEAADSVISKNLALFYRLDGMGLLQVVTARNNGRLFGYLVSLLEPSLEDETRKVAAQGMFYASPDARGIGMRIQRAAMEGLKARGGRWEVLQRAGVRGDGERLGLMFKRMGAQEYGQLYRLVIEGNC